MQSPEAEQVGHQHVARQRGLARPVLPHQEGHILAKQQFLPFLETAAGGERVPMSPTPNPRNILTHEAQIAMVRPALGASQYFVCGYVAFCCAVELGGPPCGSSVR